RITTLLRSRAGGRYFRLHRSDGFPTARLPAEKRPFQASPLHARFEDSPVNRHASLSRILVPVDDTSSSRLADGIRYLRGGSLDRAVACFEEAARSQDPRMRSEALRRLADVKRRRAEWDEALRLSGEAIAIATGHELPEEVAAALNIEGSILLQ